MFADNQPMNIWTVVDEAAEKIKKEKEKNKPPSRIPGLRDASKKQSKIVSIQYIINLP